MSEKILFSDLIKKDNVAVHCDTEAKANTLLTEANNMGLSRNFGDSYLDQNNFEIYREQTCYDLSIGGYANKEFLLKFDYQIVSFDDIIF